MRRSIKHLAIAGVILTAAAMSIMLKPMPASADMDNYGPPTAYETWQSEWDNGMFDRRHVILGTVVSFHPYRLEIERPNGAVEKIDLKHGTVIRPLGARPAHGQRVAIVGYYSDGTFIANRLVLH